MTQSFGRIGVAGCGSMGQPMAERLLAAGYDVLGYDVRPLADFGSFAQHMTTSPQDLRTCDCVISVVRDAKQTDELCFTEQAIFAETPCPQTLIVSSTLSPRFVRDLQSRLPTNTSLVDAPMSGAPHRARDGGLTFMLGGATAEIDRLRPLIDAMGNAVFHLGPLGAGMTVKVLNNYCAASGLVATRRALELANVAGVPNQTLLDVMKVSSGSNWYADNLQAIDWADEGYAPDNTIGIVLKDVTCALDIVSGETNELDEGILAALRTMPPLT